MATGLLFGSKPLSYAVFYDSTAAPSTAPEMGLENSLYHPCSRALSITFCLSHEQTSILDDIPIFIHRYIP